MKSMKKEPSHFDAALSDAVRDFANEMCGVAEDQVKSAGNEANDKDKNKNKVDELQMN